MVRREGPSIQSRVYQWVARRLVWAAGETICTRRQVLRARLLLSGLALIMAAGSWRPMPTLAQLPAGTPTYNANAKWVTDRGSQVFNVKAYGAKCDGTTDDTAAIQAAINAANPNGYPYGGAGITLIPGMCAISGTITVKGILTGLGENTNPITGNTSGTLKWIGTTSVPMLDIPVWYAAVRDLYLMGNSAYPPSDGIVIDDNGVGHYGDHIEIRDVYIGGPQGGTVYIGNGITWTGTTGGDWDRFDRIDIAGCSGNGINNTVSSQATLVLIDHLTVSYCGVGVYEKSLVRGHNWGLGSNTTADIELAGGAVEVDGIDTGPTPKMAIINGGTLELKNGGFDIANGTTLSNPVIDASGSTGGYGLRLENFGFNQFNTPGQLPQVNLCQSSGLWDPGTVVKFINVSGLPMSNVACTSPGPNTGNGMSIEFDSPDGVNDFGTHARNLITTQTIPNGMTQAFDWRRFDQTHEQDFWGGPINIHQLSGASRTPSCTPTGTGSTSYGYRITALANSYNFAGETTPSAEVTCTNAATLSSAVYNTIGWNSVLGATGYNIYCRTPSAELLCATLLGNGFSGGVNTWADTGTATPSGAIPSTNTTGILRGGIDYEDPHNSWFDWTQNWQIDGNGNASFASATINSLPATVTVASGQLAITSGTSVSAGTCGAVQSVAASGVLATDTIKFTPAADPTAVTGWGASSSGAVLSLYAYPTAGYVNFKECNSTSSAITPGALTINWEVTR
jgi:hypothetical protein